MKSDELFSWSNLFFQSALLAFEAQAVICLRLTCLATGGPRAQAEASRMITEKIDALADGQRMMIGAAWRGDPELGAKRLLSMYRRRVEANRVRLTAW
jgi:hypothetical protein